MYNTLDPIMDEQVLKEQLGLLVPLVSFLLSDQKGLNRTGGPDNSAEHNGLFLLSFLGIDMGPLVAAFFQRCGSHCRARDTDPRHAGGRLAPGHCGTITHCNWTSSERAQPAWRWSACLHSSLALICLSWGRCIFVSSRLVISLYAGSTTRHLCIFMRHRHWTHTTLRITSVSNAHPFIHLS
ncbi:hypothetical protein B0F90DRAFT_1769488 [Multifurca ochricompacta]|uniref:Uncharacterized protein n=1 Tax=Multifurca ochricompacta TaxID=376703 RepID=A0AAD4QII4_9AGAM|nr:hypothetical protein B0F90DRAFT_1769488 [Multifurca ochricompacta]